MTVLFALKRSAHLVACIIEDGGKLRVGDVAGGGKGRRTCFEVNVHITDTIHTAECFRDVLDAVRAGHALDIDGLFHGKIFLSLCGGSIRRFLMYLIHRKGDGADRDRMARVRRLRRRCVFDGEQAQTQRVQHNADA